MAGLKKLRLPTAEIEVSGGTFTVRGVSLRDVAVLVRQHGPAMNLLFDEIKAGRDITLDASLILRFGKGAIEAAPELVADLIALASGEVDPESRAIAAALPFPVQLETVKQIAMLTFETEDALGKLAETVVGMAQGVSGAMLELQKPLANGSAVSAGQ